MNCRDIEQFLMRGQSLSSEAQKHVNKCSACDPLIKALKDLARPINGIQLQPITDDFLSGLTPVKPLPSDWVLILLVLGSFLGFSLLLAAAVGLQGFSALTLIERLVYYGIVGFYGVLFSMAAVQSAIPGAIVRVGRGRIAAGAVIALALIVSLLFGDFGLDHFVLVGIPCLRFGCFSAALFGGIATILLRRGYVTDIGATALLISCFAGFSGVAVLSLYCTVQNASHVIVWHLGTMAVSGLSGVAIGAIVRAKA